MSMKRNVGRRRPRKAGKKAASVGKENHNAGREVRAKLVVSKLIENPRLSVSGAIREAGLSEYAATHPSFITSTPEWADLLDQYLPQGELLEVHSGLLKASRIDHMVFADGPKNEVEAALFLAEKPQFTRDDLISDDDIRAMLAEKNCTVRRISRTQQSRHIYFWSPDSKARKDGLDLAYKLRGSYAVDKASVLFSLASLARLRGQEPMPELPETTQANTGLSMPRSAV